MHSAAAVYTTPGPMGFATLMSGRIWSFRRRKARSDT